MGTSAWICRGLDLGETNAVIRIVDIAVGIAAPYELTRLSALVTRHERRAVAHETAEGRIDERQRRADHRPR